MSQVESYLSGLFSLEGKTALVTGAAGGIGAALAGGLAGAGAFVALCDLNPQKCAEIQEDMEQKGLKAAAFGLDVTKNDSIRACVADAWDKLNGVDILVNCAGINKREGFLDVTEQTYDRLMAVNLKGLFMMSQEVVKRMITRKKGGNIINIGSHNDEGMMGGCSVYGATKSAVRALTRSMAMEWAKHDIRANAISPGHILTPLTQVTWDHPTRGDYLRERIAMGRPGTPEEIVGLCVMLAGESSRYMTGQVYRVDGGCLCGGKPWDYDTEY